MTINNTFKKLNIFPSQYALLHFSFLIYIIYIQTAYILLSPSHSCYGYWLIDLLNTVISLTLLSFLLSLVLIFFNEAQFCRSYSKEPIYKLNQIRHLMPFYQYFVIVYVSNKFICPSRLTFVKHISTIIRFLFQ